MANATLLFTGNRNYAIGAISFDLILDESHLMGNRITNHPVETGSTIADHIENELLTGSVTALITNFSINTGELVSNRAQDAFDAMERLWRSRQVVTLVTVMKVYENVGIKSITVARSSDTGEAIVFEIAFQQVPIVDLAAVTIEATFDIGRATPESLSPAEQARIESTLQDRAR